MQTRTGKIARLPKHIREELNGRLENCQTGTQILPWLNALPEVQRILAELFGGRPISQQNLSEWRHGGYVDWANTRDSRAQWMEMLERAGELDLKRTSNGRDLSSTLGSFVLYEIGQALNEMRHTKDAEKRWRLLRTISRILSRLRNDDTREKRMQLWQSKQALREGQFQITPTNSNHKKVQINYPR